MNLFNTISGVLIGAPTAYTAVIVLRNSTLDLVESRMSRGAFDRLPAEPWATQAQARRRHAVGLALVSITLAVGMVIGISLAIIAEAWFWTGILGAAICAISYWVAVRPRQAALAARMPRSGAE